MFSPVDIGDYEGYVQRRKATSLAMLTALTALSNFVSNTALDMHRTQRHHKTINGSNQILGSNPSLPMLKLLFIQVFPAIAANAIPSVGGGCVVTTALFPLPEGFLACSRASSSLRSDFPQQQQLRTRLALSR
ncbi:hypothetical protein AMATHDRAFT_5523 [Amanita thiersii Skay4041]|uniref:Uncharacterized protein n=1 Tax=Amanita thiersii Skay4041 TaxID=703135 RepID=A0A2A9NDL8_9AGAR|nr:hypothetical protein AMATHDRAFT_5523 [Amanita thiersii Skay4041]